MAEPETFPRRTLRILGGIHNSGHKEVEDQKKIFRILAEFFVLILSIPIPKKLKTKSKLTSKHGIAPAMGAPPHLRH